jgi:hypothetical protein
MAVPLNVIVDWEDLQETIVTVGCSSDMPAVCRGVLTLAVRGGRRVFRSRFRVPPGRIGTKVLYLDEDEMHALAARRAKLMVQAPDGAGHPRSLVRIIRVEGEYPP